MERFIADEWQRLDDPAEFNTFALGIQKQLHAEGLATVPGIFRPAFVSALKRRGETLKPQSYENGRYRPLRAEMLAGTEFLEITHSRFILQLANRLLAAWDVQVDEKYIHPVVNILHGEVGSRISVYHFDSTFLTFAVPVVMPEQSQEKAPGLFRIWPNVRRFSQSKLQARVYGRLMRIGLLRDWLRSLTVRFQPGNLYIFYGFRSYHGVDSLDAEHLRINCLINVEGPPFEAARGVRRSYRFQGHKS